MADGVIKILSGDGVEGYLDGSSGTARFSKPRSFAVDLKGNLYVADKINHVIRKISDSGISFIFLSMFVVQRECLSSCNYNDKIMLR